VRFPADEQVSAARCIIAVIIKQAQVKRIFIKL